MVNRRVLLLNKTFKTSNIKDVNRGLSSYSFAIGLIR